MQADWDDAPQRGRRSRKGQGPFALALVLGCLIVGGGLYAASHLDSAQRSWNPLKAALEHRNRPVSVAVTHPTRQGGAAQSDGEIRWAEDDYDEQVRRMLAESAEAEQGGQSQRQTVFNDANYVPSGPVNTISMAVPRQTPAPQTDTAPRRGYITVVQETKTSCWPFKPGSIECRRYKKIVKNGHNLSCYNSEHKYTEACRRAALYNPVQ
ncbi:hypothetical protein [Pseudomonas sp.]|uniref:hypothetical protein n=1 Tax=Pseudomonas sp. TaxID=306 RepID=UPI002729DE23|nr:hypothetical protein [Pseudomonas sp.]